MKTPKTDALIARLRKPEPATDIICDLVRLCRKLEENNSGDIKTLAHALIEEHSSNGGHWASPDTELMLRGLCDFDESPIEALKRLAGIAKTDDKTTNPAQ